MEAALGGDGRRKEHCSLLAVTANRADTAQLPHLNCRLGGKRAPV